MKISNEAKVGLLAIIAILVLVIGFNFLKGKQLFKKTPVLYARFLQLSGLEKSNLVKVRGLPIGTVYNYMPADKEVNSVIVEIHLNKDVNIPSDSRAVIVSNPLGASSISIAKGTANTYLKSGDTLSTDLSSGLIDDLRDQITPTVTRVNQTLDTLKMTLGNINSVFDPQTNRNLQLVIGHLAVSASHLQNLLNSESGALAQSLRNMNSVTGNLARNNEAITHSIRNVEVTTTSLANARIQETVAALEATINELKGTAAGLRGSIDKINSPNGTLGAMINDRKLYDQLNRAALGLEILIDDIRVNPKRYVNISVFGGKTKTDALTSPSLKDTLPVRMR
jgi:phospholipid/cholesterol/gamma-HCH transport system substrate-binding protein